MHPSSTERSKIRIKIKKSKGTWSVLLFPDNRIFMNSVDSDFQRVIDGLRNSHVKTQSNKVVTQKWDGSFIYLKMQLDIKTRINTARQAKGLLTMLALENITVTNKRELLRFFNEKI